ncbi:MAG TPA: lytic transglycosylase domain-containing protein [Rhodopila sp.]
MTATSILDVQVNDESFRNYVELFNKYRASVGELPGAWKDIAKQNEENSHVAETIVAALAAQTAILGEQLQQHSKIGDAAGRTNDKLRETDDRFKSLRHNAASVTAELLKWGSMIGTIGSALAIGGSLFGLDRLGAAATALNYGARGLGVNPAMQQAFGINFRRYTDPNSMLANTAAVQADQSKWYALNAAGIGYNEIAGDNPAQLSQRIVERARALWDQAGPNNRTAQFMQAYGLDQLLPGGLQDWRRIGSYSTGDIARSGQQTGIDARDFALHERALKDWTEFTTQMERAKTSIEDALIEGLAPLAPSLTHLSSAVVHMINELAHDPDIGHWIDELAAGVEWFAKYLTSQDFKSDLQTAKDDFHAFETALGSIVDWAQGVLTRLGILSGSAPRGPSSGPHGSNPQTDPQSLDYQPPLRDSDLNPDGTRSSVWTRHIPGLAQDPNNPRGIAGIRHWLGHNGMYFRLPGMDAHGNLPGSRDYDPSTDPATIDRWKQSAVVAPNSAIPSLERAAADKNGVPLDFMRGIFGLEAGLNPDGTPRVSPAGAIGIGQLMPGTAGRYHANPFDTAQNIDGSARYLHFLLNMFHGDQLAAAAAYNAGEGNAGVQKFFASGDTDMSGLPNETQKYVSNLIKRYGISAHPAEQETPRPDLIGRGAAPGGAMDKLAEAIDRLRRSSPPQGGGRTAVVVQNQTGGSVVVNTAQLAH